LLIYFDLPNIVRVIKSRMVWAGHVTHMGKMRNVYKILVGKCEGKRSLARCSLGGKVILDWILKK
jgi:hypothetical protein